MFVQDLYIVVYMYDCFFLRAIFLWWNFKNH